MTATFLHLISFSVSTGRLFVFQFLMPPSFDFFLCERFIEFIKSYLRLFSLGFRPSWVWERYLHLEVSVVVGSV